MDSLVILSVIHVGDVDYRSCPNYRNSSEQASLLLARVDCPFHHNIKPFLLQLTAFEIHLTMIA